MVSIGGRNEVGCSRAQPVCPTTDNDGGIGSKRTLLDVNMRHRSTFGIHKSLDELCQNDTHGGGDYHGARTCPDIVRNPEVRKSKTMAPDEHPILHISTHKEAISSLLRWKIADEAPDQDEGIMP